MGQRRAAPQHPTPDSGKGIIHQEPALPKPQVTVPRNENPSPHPLAPGNRESPRPITPPPPAVPPKAAPVAPGQHHVVPLPSDRQHVAPPVLHQGRTPSHRQLPPKQLPPGQQEHRESP
jgi:hypothetical protein